MNCSLSRIGSSSIVAPWRSFLLPVCVVLSLFGTRLADDPLNLPLLPMPYQNNRFLPPLATPVTSTYQKDYHIQDSKPAKSYKARVFTNLPPINYSRHRHELTSHYLTSYEGMSGPPAPTAKPSPYKFPSMDPYGISTYQADFIKQPRCRSPEIPTSPGRKHNPHPRTMANAFNFPQRGYWVWPHRLNPMWVERSPCEQQGKRSKHE